MAWYLVKHRDNFTWTFTSQVAVACVVTAAGIIAVKTSTVAGLPAFVSLQPIPPALFTTSTETVILSVSLLT